MSKKKRGPDMAEVAAGAGIIVASLLIPTIGEEVIAIPLGLGMIAHGFRYI